MLKINRPFPADQVRLLIFDLDGTLVDSKIDLANATNAMLRNCNRQELPCEVITGYIGDGAAMLVRRALGQPDDEPFVQTALEFFLGWYRQHELDNTRAYPGIAAALDRLRESGNFAGRNMAVLSNKPEDHARSIIEALGLGEYFVRVCGGDTFGTRKPDAFGALQLARDAGVEPGESAILGDSHNDILTARNAGMWAIGLTYGFSPQTLNAAPPDILLDSPEEIPLVFEGSEKLLSIPGHWINNP